MAIQIKCTSFNSSRFFKGKNRNIHRYWIPLIYFLSLIFIVHQSHKKWVNIGITPAVQVIIWGAAEGYMGWRVSFPLATTEIKHILLSRTVAEDTSILGNMFIVLKYGSKVGNID